LLTTTVQSKYCTCRGKVAIWVHQGEKGTPMKRKGGLRKRGGRPASVGTRSIPKTTVAKRKEGKEGKTGNLGGKVVERGSKKRGVRQPLKVVRKKDREREGKGRKKRQVVQPRVGGGGPGRGGNKRTANRLNCTKKAQIKKQD